MRTFSRTVPIVATRCEYVIDYFAACASGSLTISHCKSSTNSASLTAERFYLIRSMTVTCKAATVGSAWNATFSAMINIFTLIQLRVQDVFHELPLLLFLLELGRHLLVPLFLPCVDVKVMAHLPSSGIVGKILVLPVTMVTQSAPMAFQCDRSQCQTLQQTPGNVCHETGIHRIARGLRWRLAGH